jgi:hypothetical protein
LSLLLTPSIEMLTKVSGSPLIVESRFVPVVLMPGRKVTAFSAFLVGVGSRVSWSAFRVAATVAFCVDQFRAAGDRHRLLELTDLERERNADRLTRCDPDHLRDCRLEAAQRGRHGV